jgi:hypothetical protein
MPAGVPTHWQYAYQPDAKKEHAIPGYWKSSAKHTLQLRECYMHFVTISV